MLLTVTRKWFSDKASIGELTLDGDFQCYTLEDRFRELPNLPVLKWKIGGQSAIPMGLYDVTVDMSTRFKRLMPHILNVPGFDGVRIHSGNTDADTEGCILVGWTKNGDDFIGESRKAFDALFPKIQDAIGREPVHILIKRAGE